jgi:hypothetical protein
MIGIIMLSASDASFCCETRLADGIASSGWPLIVRPRCRGVRMAVSGISPGQGEVRQALRSIVADPDYGVDALSSRRAMESLLKDMLPDRPREAAILIAAAEHGLAAMLRERVSQEGMDAATATRLVAAIFAKATAFTPDACEWAVTELAIAMGMDDTTLQARRTAADQPAMPLLNAATAPQPGIHAPPTGVTVPPPEWATAPGGGTPLSGRETVAAPQPFAAPPGYGYVGFPPPAAPQPRRRAVWFAVAGVAAVAIGAVAAAVVLLNKSSLPTPAIMVSAATANNAVDGNEYVYYQVKGLANATITATVAHGTNGEVAQLTAQPYPFEAPAQVVNSAKITGGRQRVSFQVTPSLATRYRVQILRSPGASSALATSKSQTVYVALIAHYKYRQKTCPRPQCFVTILFTVPVAQAALRAELDKHVYVYWGINLAASGPEPADPTTLNLQEQLHTTDPTALSGKYHVTLAFKFTVNNDAFRYHWNICTKADVSADGIGLPGASQCGSPSIPAQRPGYLGSLAG